MYAYIVTRWRLIRRRATAIITVDTENKCFTRRLCSIVRIPARLNVRGSGGSEDSSAETAGRRHGIQPNAERNFGIRVVSSK